MNWDMISALAEMIGVIAIFVSLLYLAIQIRQTKDQITDGIKADQLAAFERNTVSGNRMRELLILNPDLAELYMKGRRSYLELTSSEKFRFGMLLRNMFSSMQAAYIRQIIFSHDPLGTQGMAKIVDDVLLSPGVREFLETYQPDWRPEFKEFVFDRLDKIVNEEAG